MPGSSARRSTSPTSTAGRVSSRCRTTTTCCTARKSGRCCRCAQAEGIGVIPWSPLARGRLTRPWNEATERTADRRVRQDALHVPGRAPIARSSSGWRGRGRTRCPARPGGARLGARKPAVTAPIVGASKTAPSRRCGVGAGGAALCRRDCRARGRIRAAPDQRPPVAAREPAGPCRGRSRIYANIG